MKKISCRLEEYVITDKIADNLIRFFDTFNETALDERKNVGVWISGFFGSGKSHFAKILGYLLENKQIEGKSATDIFLGRIKGLDREMEIKGLLHEASMKIKAHSIMYQIESEHDQLEEKKTIAKTVYRQFLKFQGLFLYYYQHNHCNKSFAIPLLSYKAFPVHLQPVPGRNT